MYPNKLNYLMISTLQNKSLQSFQKTIFSGYYIYLSHEFRGEN